MSGAHQLRPYQQQAVDQIRALFSQGHRKVLLHLATGGGKTTVFSYILKSLADRGNKGAIVVRGRKLVDQAHKRLLREGVSHGVMMNNHWNVNRLAPIHVCSIDTLQARDISLKGSLLVIDEAHMFTSESCIAFCNRWSKENPDGFILAVTATPYVNTSLRHLADVVVKTVSMQDLIDTGFLVPPLYYAPTVPNLEGVKISASTKDYVSADLENALNNNDIVGDLVTTWRKYAQDRSTLVFAVSIAHSKHIAEMFNEAGIAAVHCDADSTDAERDDAVRRLESGELKVISNVGIFCTGVDIPSLGCIQFARPTQSYNLYIQMAGRGTRPCPNLYGSGRDKANFILLDNAGNILRHGRITDEPEANIHGKRASIGASILIKTCKACFAVYDRFSSQCPECGAMNVVDTTGERMANHVAGDLLLMDEMPLLAKARQRLTDLKKTRKEKGFKSGFVYYKMRDEFGEEIANQFCPKRQVPEWLKKKI